MLISAGNLRSFLSQLVFPPATFVRFGCCLLPPSLQLGGVMSAVLVRWLGPFSHRPPQISRGARVPALESAISPVTNLGTGELQPPLHPKHHGKAAFPEQRTASPPPTVESRHVCSSGPSVPLSSLTVTHLRARLGPSAPPFRCPLFPPARPPARGKV